MCCGEGVGETNDCVEVLCRKTNKIMEGVGRGCTLL